MKATYYILAIVFFFLLVFSVSSANVHLYDPLIHTFRTYSYDNTHYRNAISKYDTFNNPSILEFDNSESYLVSFYLNSINYGLAFPWGVSVIGKWDDGSDIKLSYYNDSANSQIHPNISINAAHDNDNDKYYNKIQYFDVYVNSTLKGNWYYRGHFKGKDSNDKFSSLTIQQGDLYLDNDNDGYYGKTIHIKDITNSILSNIGKSYYFYFHDVGKDGDDYCNKITRLPYSHDNVIGMITDSDGDGYAKKDSFTKSLSCPEVTRFWADGATREKGKFLMVDASCGGRTCNSSTGVGCFDYTHTHCIKGIDIDDSIFACGASCPVWYTPYNFMDATCDKFPCCNITSWKKHTSGCPKYLISSGDFQWHCSLDISKKACLPSSSHHDYNCPDFNDGSRWYCDNKNNICYLKTK